MITCPKGFRFAATSAGFKCKEKLDLALILSDFPAVAAGTFTRNIFSAAPVQRSKEILKKNSQCRALLVNSGQANACTGAEGYANCCRTQELVAESFDITAEDILVASTGVIGTQLIMDKWLLAIPKARKALGKSTAEDVAKAIMTTDTVHKLVSTEVELSSGTVRLLGMAKGAGMICPDMATLLGFILCDAQVEAKWWDTVLKDCVNRSFNRITVDGDTSTNDTIFALANGASKIQATQAEDKAVLAKALRTLCQSLAFKIVEDAEGGTKVARICVQGAKNETEAELVARAIGHSPLVKTALFGCDPNWGRIVAAAGRSGAIFQPEELELRIGSILVFEKGQAMSGNMDELLAPIMARPEIRIEVKLGAGSGEYEFLASDFSKEYVSINADYRS